MSDDDARDRLKRSAWGDGEPVCPHCGCVGAWTINTKQRRKDGSVAPRHLYKCKAKECRRQFTLTSGNLFKSLKVPLRDGMFSIFEFSRGAKGYAALAQCFQTGLSYKSAYVFE